MLKFWSLKSNKSDILLYHSSSPLFRRKLMQLWISHFFEFHINMSRLV